MESVFLCNDMIQCEVFDTKNVIFNLEGIIKGITDLKTRKFVIILSQ